MGPPRSLALLLALEENWGILIMNTLLEPVIETDMQRFCVEIMKRLDCQRRNEYLCDVILEVGSGDNQARLKAHKNVLCAASPFFYNALNTEMKEKKEGVIRLKDTSKALMEEVLEYLYTGHVDINDKNAFELMAVADYLLIPSLKLVCSKLIEQTLCISNCILAYYSSVKYQCAELQDRAGSFIFANFMAVTETEDFFNLSVEQVEDWISNDEVVVKGEEEVFMVILRWTTKNDQRKQRFFELFRHVRCVYVSRNYLITVILQHQFVKSKKQCLDLVLSALEKLSDGTEECFLNQSPRNCLNTHEDAIFACRGGGGDKMLCYLPSQNKWYKITSRVHTRNPYALAASAYRGKLYVVGGNSSNEVERYDPLLNSWASVKSLKEELRFAAAVTFQGFLYVIGGIDKHQKHLSAVQRYNSDANMWHEVGLLSSPRSRICAVSDGNNIYAIGGLDSSGNLCNIVERFDPEVNSWTKIAPTQAKRRHASGVSLHSRMFVLGGVHELGGCPCEMYDKGTNIWTEMASTVAPRYPTSAVCFKEQIFVFGRFGPNQSDRDEMTLQVYDVDKDEWKPCRNISLGPHLYKLSAGRISREVLNSCEEI